MLRAVLLACLLTAAAAGAGCGLEPGSGQCKEAVLAGDPVTITDPLAPLMITATLTADGEPIVGVEVDFATITTGLPNVPEGQRGGHHIGEATTDAGGVARFVRDEGIDGLLLPGEELVGFKADFTSLEKVDDVQYCRTRTDISVTI